jgi:hypothetical protein
MVTTAAAMAAVEEGMTAMVATAKVTWSDYENIGRNIFFNLDIF